VTALTVTIRDESHKPNQSIDLARTPKVKTKNKDTDKDLPTDVDYDYHESSLHDSVLKDQMLRGYQEFKARSRDPIYH